MSQYSDSYLIDLD